MRPLLASVALCLGLPLMAVAEGEIFIPGDDTLQFQPEASPSDPLAACLLNADAANCAAQNMADDSGGVVFESAGDIAYETLVLDLDAGKVTKSEKPPVKPVDYKDPEPPRHGKVELPSVAITIEFDYNSHTVRPDQLGKVNSLIKAMQDPALSGAHYAVIGHTDAKGSFGYNCDLSYRRAAEVARALQVNYVTVPLYPVGWGEYVLKDEYYPESAANRRVTFLRLPDQYEPVLHTAQEVCAF